MAMLNNQMVHPNIYHRSSNHCRCVAHWEYLGQVQFQFHQKDRLRKYRLISSVAFIVVFGRCDMPNAIQCHKLAPILPWIGCKKNIRKWPNGSCFWHWVYHNTKNNLQVLYHETHADPVSPSSSWSAKKQTWDRRSLVATISVFDIDDCHQLSVYFIINYQLSYIIQKPNIHILWEVLRMVQLNQVIIYDCHHDFLGIKVLNIK